MMSKKILFKAMLMSTIIIVPPIVLTSCSSVTTSLYFAELVVSDNTSVLKDKSFSETSYKGWRDFMVANTINPKTGDASYVSETNNKASNNNETYKKEAIRDMPDINSKSKALFQGKGIWRRPNKSRDLTFRQIFSGGSNLIIAPGFNHQQAIETVASKEKEKGFLFLDGVPQTKDGDKWIREYPNVASFLFRAEQSGFMSGVAAGEFLNINQDVFTKDDGELKVGGFLGLALGSTVDFLAGFQHGIIAYNNKIKSNSIPNNNKTINGMTRMPIKWVDLGNEIGSYSVGSFSPGQGTQKSRELIQRGADMIIPIAGPQTSDLVAAINSQTNPRPVTIVGVDSAQELNESIQKTFDSKIIEKMGRSKLKDAKGQPFEKQKIIQFSAIKKLDEATTKVLGAIFNKKDPNNSSATEGSVVKGFGYLNVGSLGNETVGVSDAGLSYVLNVFPDWEKKDSTKNSKIKLDTSKIYNNNEFKKLETNGVLYRNIDNIDLNSTSNNVVRASVISGEGNKLVSPISGNDYSPKATNLYDKEKPLNGSNWGMEKGTLISETNNKYYFNRKED